MSRPNHDEEGGAWRTLTSIESKVAVVSTPEAWLVTASPMSPPVRFATSTLPTIVQFEPSTDTQPTKVFERRCSLSHVGIAWKPPATKVVVPPSAVRAMNSMPPSGFTSRSTCGDEAEVDDRSISPAFAYGLVFCRLVTRAII